jgi:hypothetical protein
VETAAPAERMETISLHGDYWAAQKAEQAGILHCSLPRGYPNR